MSADNWNICPRCSDAAEKLADEQAAAVYAQYGNVPAPEFEELRAGLEPFDPEKCRTFREDYEFWTTRDHGKATLHVDYGGACSACNLRHEFKRSEVFYEPATESENKS